MDVVRRGRHLLSLSGLGPGEVQALERLVAEGAPSEELADLVLEIDGPAALAHWYGRVERLHGCGAVRETIRRGDCPVLHLDVIAPGGRVEPRSPGAGSLVLSRFAVIRREGSTMVAESPRSRMRVTLADADAAALLHRLSIPQTVGSLAPAVPGWTPTTLRSVLGALVAAGIVLHVDDDDRTEEDRSPTLRTWEAQDLQFHVHSRSGRHDRPVGGVLPFQGELEPLPALSPPRGTRRVALPAVDRDRIEAADPTLFQAMETRESRRPPFDRALELGELSTLLWRTARVRPERRWEGAPQEVLSRPHASGGATFPLEWYVVQGNVEGLGPGIFHYLPGEHALEEVVAGTGVVHELLASYGVDATGSARTVPVLLVLAGRFGRINWKYRSVAYALLLKEVGVVFQSLHLVATAMGLDGCPLGTGDDLRFARIAGLDSEAEAPVGEFLLGGIAGDGTGVRLRSCQASAS